MEENIKILVTVCPHVIKSNKENLSLASNNFDEILDVFVKELDKVNNDSSTNKKITFISEGRSILEKDIKAIESLKNIEVEEVRSYKWYDNPEMLKTITECNSAIFIENPAYPSKIQTTKKNILKEKGIHIIPVHQDFNTSMPLAEKVIVNVAGWEVNDIKEHILWDKNLVNPITGNKGAWFINNEHSLEVCKSYVQEIPTLPKEILTNFYMGKINKEELEQEYNKYLEQNKILFTKFRNDKEDNNILIENFTQENINELQEFSDLYLSEIKRNIPKSKRLYIDNPPDNFLQSEKINTYIHKNELIYEFTSEEFYFDKSNEEIKDFLNDENIGFKKKNFNLRQYFNIDINGFFYSRDELKKYFDKEWQNLLKKEYNLTYDWVKKKYYILDYQKKNIQNFFHDFGDWSEKSDLLEVKPKKKNTSSKEEIEKIKLKNLEEIPAKKRYAIKKIANSIKKGLVPYKGLKVKDKDFTLFYNVIDNMNNLVSTSGQSTRDLYLSSITINDEQHLFIIKKEQYNYVFLNEKDKDYIFNLSISEEKRLDKIVALKDKVIESKSMGYTPSPKELKFLMQYMDKYLPENIENMKGNLYATYSSGKDIFSLFIDKENNFILVSDDYKEQYLKQENIKEIEGNNDILIGDELDNWELETLGREKVLGSANIYEDKISKENYISEIDETTGFTSSKNMEEIDSIIKKEIDLDLTQNSVENIKDNLTEEQTKKLKEEFKDVSFNTQDVFLELNESAFYNYLEKKNVEIYSENDEVVFFFNKNKLYKAEKDDYTNNFYIEEAKNNHRTFIKDFLNSKQELKDFMLFIKKSENINIALNNNIMKIVEVTPQGDEMDYGLEVDIDLTTGEFCIIDEKIDVEGNFKEPQELLSLVNENDYQNSTNYNNQREQRFEIQ